MPALEEALNSKKLIFNQGENKSSIYINSFVPSIFLHQLELVLGSTSKATLYLQRDVCFSQKDFLQHERESKERGTSVTLLRELNIDSDLENNHDQLLKYIVARYPNMKLLDFVSNFQFGKTL